MDVAAFEQAEREIARHLLVGGIGAPARGRIVEVVHGGPADAELHAEQLAVALDVANLLRRIEVQVADLDVLRAKADAAPPVVRQALLEFEGALEPVLVVAFAEPFPASAQHVERDRLIVPVGVDEIDGIGAVACAGLEPDGEALAAAAPGLPGEEDLVRDSPGVSEMSKFRCS